MDGWKMKFPFGGNLGIFSGANLLFVWGRLNFLDSHCAMQGIRNPSKNHYCWACPLAFCKLNETSSWTNQWRHLMLHPGHIQNPSTASSKNKSPHLQSTFLVALATFGWNSNICLILFPNFQATHGPFLQQESVDPPLRLKTWPP